MAEYISKPFNTIFRGEMQIPSQFVLAYKARDKTSPAGTIQFFGIQENGMKIELCDAQSLDSKEPTDLVIGSPMVPIAAFFYKIANMQDVESMFSLVMVTKQSTPLTFHIN